MPIEFVAAVLILILLKVADWRTTRAVLLSNKGHETVRFTAWLIGKIGLDKALITEIFILAAVAISVARYLAPSDPLGSMAVLAFLIGRYSVIVATNAKIAAS